MTTLPLHTLLAVAILSSGALRAEEPVDFAREILPILSDKCFACHGPDTKVIDTYIATGHKFHQPGITFAPEADRPTLARRAALILTGLPLEPKLLGIDHRKLTYRYQGRDFRLTDIHGHVIKELLM